MNVAMHDAVAIADGDARATVRERAAEAGFDNVTFVDFSSAIDFVDKMAAKGGQLVELAILPYKMPGLSGLQAITEARVSQPQLYAIVVDDAPAHAAEASQADVDGYLAQPITSQDFCLMLDRAFAALRKLLDGSFVLNVRDGLRRIIFDDVVYCETSGHDQLLHLRDRSVLIGRYSSQALFELLAVDQRFFKVGSSYIVNLHEISRLHVPSGELALYDGTAIPVPQRLRKSLEEALLA